MPLPILHYQICCRNTHSIHSFLHYQRKACMIKRLFTFHTTSSLSTVKSPLFPFRQRQNKSDRFLSLSVQYMSPSFFTWYQAILFHRYAKVRPWKYPFHTAITWWCLSWSALPTRPLYLDLTSRTWRNFLWNQQGKYDLTQHPQF